jgi:hypothetical protein
LLRHQYYGIINPEGRLEQLKKASGEPWGLRSKRMALWPILIEKEIEVKKNHNETVNPKEDGTIYVE